MGVFLNFFSPRNQMLRLQAIAFYFLAFVGLMINLNGITFSTYQSRLNKQSIGKISLIISLVCLLIAIVATVILLVVFL